MSEARPSWAQWYDPDDSEGLDYDTIPGDIAGEELFNMIVDLKLRNVLSARQACVLAFWAYKAGAQGDVEKLALHPACQSGKYSRKFDVVAGTQVDDACLYQVPTAVRHRHDPVRKWCDVPMLLPLEELVAEIREDPEVSAELKRSLDAGELPPLFTQNPLVQGAPAAELVFPLSLYFDGIAHHRLDSALAISCYVTTGGKRHVIAILRRSEICTCGCKGWCSLHSIWSAIAWQLASLAEGKHPMVRHDGSPFRASEAFRQELAGKALGFRAVVLFLKSDIVEYSHSLGLPAHNDTIAPCPVCFSTLEDFSFDCSALSPTGTGYVQRTATTYDTACRACEITVAPDRPTVELMRQALHYEKTKQGPAGRALLSDDFHHLGLRRRDRLEPTRGLPDVGDFEFRRLPLLATFWRRSCETSARHRNPIFGPATGVSVQNIGLDWLHILSLGVIQLFLMNLVWDLVHSNVMNITGSMQNVFEITIARMKGELNEFYTAEARAGRTHTKCQQLLPTMFGSNTARKFALHGAETNGFLAYCVSALPRWLRLGPRHRHYSQGCRSLVGILDAIRRYPRMMPPEASMQFVHDVADHLRACSELDIVAVSKHHFLMEMAGRCVGSNARAAEHTGSPKGPTVRKSTIGPTPLSPSGFSPGTTGPGFRVWAGKISSGEAGAPRWKRACWISGGGSGGSVVFVSARLDSHGSPGYQSCWSDESANFELKRICRGAHAAHWNARVLINWRAVEGRRRA